MPLFPPANLPFLKRLKLSDAFLEKPDILYAEAVVDVINVNYEKGAELLAQCRTLQEYSLLIYRIHCCYEKGIDLKTAIETSIAECIAEGIPEEFFKRHGGDIVNFLYQELSREECEAIREEGGYARGYVQGEASAKKQFAALAKIMITEKRGEELLAAAEDEALCRRLYEEYGICGDKS